MGTATAQKPLDRMLAAFPDARQQGNGWWHHADNPDFSWLELPNGNIRIRSWTARDEDSILAMGKIKLTRAHLYARKGQYSQVEKRDKLDLLTLADYMCIDWQFLMREGYSDGYTYTARDGRITQCVKIGGYCMPDGKEHTKHQVRLSLHEKTRFLWDQNTPGEIMPCGLHYLDRARAAGYLMIGEGGSDWATMTFHGLPFIGIPGAGQAKKLDVSLLEGIPVVYIIEEPDQAKKLNEQGQGFYSSMRAHLRENGYQGAIFSIRFQEATGYKDPSDLHKAIHRACKEQAEGPFRAEVHKRFIEAIEQAMMQAIPEGNADLLPRAKGERDWSQISFEEFSCMVWAVPQEFLNPLQKIVICQLFRYMRDHEPGELGWEIDALSMAREVGITGKNEKVVREKYLGIISYLHEKMGILAKERRANKRYINGSDEIEQVRYEGQTVYIAYKPAFFIPTGYAVVTQDEQRNGGPRLPMQECEYCGSKHLKHYAVQCVDCGHVMYPPPEEEETLPPEKVIESTLSNADQSTDPEATKLVASGIENESAVIESITNHQTGSFGIHLFDEDKPAPAEQESIPIASEPIRKGLLDMERAIMDYGTRHDYPAIGEHVKPGLPGYNEVRRSRKLLRLAYSLIAAVVP
jgi:hypothetical protein